MVKPTVFSVEQEPKKDKSTDVHLIAVKEMSYKSGFDDDEPLVTSRTEVCTVQRCACAVLLILIGLGCLIGAGIGLYIHLNTRDQPTLIITGPGHPYGNDALYPPDFHHPPRVGGHFDGHMPEFHHGSRDRAFEPMRPRPSFPGHHGLPFGERPFGHDGLEPPMAGPGNHPAPPPPPPHNGPGHERPGVEHAAPGPHGKHHPGPGGPRREHAPGPEYDIHHGGPEVHDHGRRRGKGNRPLFHGSMP